MPEWAQFAALLGVGVVTGFINILAGGGSLLTLPLLIFLGLPAAVAIGTNRIAILMQNTVAIRSFHQLNVLPWRSGLYASIPALIGAAIGATLAVDMPEQLLKRILAGVMVMVLIIILIDPARRIKFSEIDFTPRRRFWFAFGFFIIGFYGGFIQAGVGFLVITNCLLAGFDLVKTNALKVLVIFIFNLLALGIFMYHGQVDVVFGVALGIGNAIGGYIAAHTAVRKGHNWMKGFVVTAVLIFAAKLLLDSL